MDKVRSKLRGGNRRGKRGDLFRSRYTLLKGAERLADWKKERLCQLFYCYPKLKRAWLLKESFRAWYRETNRRRAGERLALPRLVLDEVQGRAWLAGGEDSQWFC